MALRGNLKDFSLPDVFQLVTFSRKTGVLRIVQEDGAEGSVWFRDGDVFFASSNWHSQPLGERLVRSQRITPQALERALEIRRSEPTGRRLGQILVDEAYITQKVLESFVQEQIQDTIFDLMRWDDGDFDFEPMPSSDEEDIGLSVSIENVVMEGSRRLEEWARIRKKIPSMDIVFKMATAPGEGVFEISLKPTEWELLLLVDSTRSVAELATATRHTDFEVARVAYGLFSAGLLEFATDEEIERHRAERREREALLARVETEHAANAREAERVMAVATTSSGGRENDHASRPSVVSAPPNTDGMPMIPVVAAPVSPDEPAHHVHVDIPEFLDAQSDSPTVEDQAVLEEFMGALLSGPAEEAQSLDVPAAARAPHVPAEEPAFITAQPDLLVDSIPISVTRVEGFVGMDIVVTGVPDEAPTGPTASVPGLVSSASAPWPSQSASRGGVSAPAGLPPESADSDSPAAPEVALRPVDEGARQGSEFDIGASIEQPPRDFARDLMAIGLGELDDAPPPSAASESGDLAAAAGGLEPLPASLCTSEPVAQAQVEMPGRRRGAPASGELVSMSPEPPALDARADVDEIQTDVEASSLTESTDSERVAETALPDGLGAVDGALERDEAVEPATPDMSGERTGSSESVDLIDLFEPAPQETPYVIEVMPGGEPETESLHDEVDFTGLINSLDSEDELPVRTSAGAPGGSLDGALLEDTVLVQPDGVISTDAFMPDVEVEELGFTDGINHELSALTGADRRTPKPRPQASVNSLPDDSAAGLHRDPRVDRDTVLRIIHGIEGL